MRRRIEILLLLTLIAPLLAAPAYSAIKTGSSCKIYKQKTTYKNTVYKCVKSGKKLIWNKGVVIKKPTPTAQNEVPVGKWQETQFAIVEALSLLKPSDIQKLNFVYSPNVNNTEADKLQASYQEPISLLSNLYVNPRPVTFLVMSETEHDWWWSQANLLTNRVPADWWGGGHCQPNPRSHCGYGSMVEPDGTFHFGQLLGSKFVWTDYDYTIACHESIHVYQLGLMGNRMNELPFWFAEGQASYLGPAFSHKYRNSKDQREEPLRRLRNSFPETSSYKLSDWITWLKHMDSDSSFTFKNELGYSIGELIMECLYNSNDFTKIHEWMVSIKSGNNYKDGFKEVIGQDYDRWIETTVAPYIDSQI